MKESEEKIKKYLEEEYQLNDYELEVKDGWIIINTESDVNVPQKLEKLFPFEKVKFGKVGGNFSCEKCSSLLSLEGAPNEVNGDFNCDSCEVLKSLEGAPKKVGGDFSCYRCYCLTNLKGASKEVGGGFYCQQCDGLTNLEGAPGKVGGDFCCGQCCALTSLDGAPKEVLGGSFECYECDALTSLKGAPKEVGTKIKGEQGEFDGRFNCSYCYALTSLEGAPEIVGGIFDCSGCSALTSLKGAPREVGGDFDCHECEALSSFEGAPDKVEGSFYCQECSALTSLKGAPKEVGGNFSCRGCSALTSLEGAPEIVGGDFSCRDCSSLTTMEGAPKKLGGRMMADMEYNSNFDEDEDGEFESDEVDERLVYLTEILARVINQGGLDLSDKDKDELYKQVIRDAGFNSKLQDFKEQLQKKIDMFVIDSDQLYDYERLEGIVNKVSFSMDVVPNAVEDVILADGKVTINDIYELNHIMDAQEYHNEKRFIFYAMFFEKVVEMAKKGKLKIVENN